MRLTRACGPNPLPPEQMTPAERRAELCGLLALGLVRLRGRQSSGQSGVTGERSLGFAPGQSGHATTEKRRPA